MPIAQKEKQDQGRDIEAAAEVQPHPDRQHNEQIGGDQE